VAEREITLRPLPGVSLRVVGDRSAVGHFEAEYGPTQDHVEAAAANLRVSFPSRLTNPQGRDGHKSVSWEVRLDQAGGKPSELSIALHGRPRWFGLSLVQGFLVEPCLSLLAPGLGEVLVPAAGIALEDGVDLLIGRSQTGKSSLSMRALAAGVPVLGDDQVVVTRDGTCVRFPRRLRVYDDLSTTAPRAASRLPLSYRAGLTARRLARLATGGRVAPSLAVPASALGVPGPTSAPLRRVVLLARDSDVSVPRLRDADAEQAVARCSEALTQQRSRLVRSIGSSLSSSLEAAVEAEEGILRSAFASVPIVAVDLPSGMDAVSAVGSLARLLGLP
jgi:hypothetical protein